VGGALALFLVLVLCAYKACQLRRYTAVPRMEVLFNNYWDRSVTQTKAVLTVTIADACDENEVLVAGKEWWTKAVLTCLVAQACPSKITRHRMPSRRRRHTTTTAKALPRRRGCPCHPDPRR